MALRLHDINAIISADAFDPDNGVCSNEAGFFGSEYFHCIQLVSF
jgi:hypothetical protein